MNIRLAVSVALDNVEDEGYQAGRDGAPASDNPYPWCPYREAWERGRQQGMADRASHENGGAAD